MNKKQKIRFSYNLKHTASQPIIDLLVKKKRTNFNKKFFFFGINQKK